MEGAAEDAGEVDVEDVNDFEPVHPPTLINKNPALLLDPFYFALDVLQAYGWFIVIALVLAYLLYRRLQPLLGARLQRREEEQDLHRYDSSAALRRQEAMDAARRRLQEQHDAQAARYAEEQAKKEAERRNEKIADWDRHLEGKGYRSKYRPTEDDANGGVAPRPPGGAKKKPVYRASDYNPLTGQGGGSGSCFRPPGRGGRAGGG